MSYLNSHSPISINNSIGIDSNSNIRINHNTSPIVINSGNITGGGGGGGGYYNGSSTPFTYTYNITIDINKDEQKTFTIDQIKEIVKKQLIIENLAKELPVVKEALDNLEMAFKLCYSEENKEN